MKKIAAGILVAVLAASAAVSGAVKAGNRQDTSNAQSSWNNGICVNRSVCPNYHDHTGGCVVSGNGACYTDSDHDGVCDNYQDKTCNNADGHHMHHQNSGCRGGRNR